MTQYRPSGIVGILSGAHRGMQIVYLVKKALKHLASSDAGIG
jgi:hypothetical protein